MADEEQLRILKQGVEAWNDWRRKNPGITAVDLSGADLREMNLLGAELSRANLDEAILLGANLSGAHPQTAT
jgi:hypothetical protein